MKKDPCAGFLVAVVLPQVDKVEDVVVPRLEVDGEGPWTFVAPLVDVASSRVVCAEHRYNTVRVAVRASNIWPANNSSQDQETILNKTKKKNTYPVARIQWIFNPIPPAVLLIIAQFFSVS